MKRMFIWMAFFSLCMTACLETLDEPKEIECLFGTVFHNGTCIPVDNEHCGNPKQAFKVCGENQVCKSVDYNYICVCKEEFMTCGKDAALCQTNVYSERHNCGKCGKECPVELDCYKGKCVCLDDNNNVVTDLNTNENCGKCGFKCPLGSDCNNGTCSCGEYENGKLMATCTADKICETNLWNNPEHCGKCGNACPSSDGKNGLAICKSGKCECSDGLILCDGQCVPENNDHCGTKCEACLDGSKCEGTKGNKTCKCPDDKIYCDGRCVESDELNCGTCNKKCSETERCMSNKCECKENYIRCGVQCVDPLRDKAYCGSIGASCSDLKNCDFEVQGYSICVNGKCNELKCPDGVAAGKNDPKHCGEQCKVCKENENCFGGKCSVCETPNKVCGVDCINTQTSNDHCGDCDIKCPPNTRCRGGKCVCREGFIEKYRYADGIKVFVACVQDCDGQICAPGSVCTQKGGEEFYCLCADESGALGDRCDAITGYSCQGMKCGCSPGYTQKMLVEIQDGNTLLRDLGCFADCDGVKCADNTLCLKRKDIDTGFTCRCTDGNTAKDICPLGSGVCSGQICNCNPGYIMKITFGAQGNILREECVKDCDGEQCGDHTVCIQNVYYSKSMCVCQNSNKKYEEVCQKDIGVCSGKLCNCKPGYTQKFQQTHDNFVVTEGCTESCDGSICPAGAACIKAHGETAYSCHCYQKWLDDNGNVRYQWDPSACSGTCHKGNCQQ